MPPVEGQAYHLDKERHIKYWKRCAQILPEPYTAGESSRMSFGFFIVAALDLLGALDTVVPATEQRSWIEWIYGCQVVHTGGFRGFTGTMMGGLRSYHNWHWDPANLPNTFFALATLVLLGDDLGRVKKRECLAWVRSLQRPNGSFGEFLGEDDAVEGADDPRHCMCAVGIMKILQGIGGKGDGQTGGDYTPLDEMGLRRYIANCQSPAVSMDEMARQAKVDLASCTRWMLDRQTTWIEEEEDEDENDEEDEGQPHYRPAPEQQYKQLEPQQSLFDLSPMLESLKSETLIAGFCGRCGKMADTCYCFWNVGALAVSTST
ncbi:geranylgeranyl transferase beta subunit [Cladophialophora carrionii]|uniref:Geranylgeranyl transferase beta subunit n=1 Tax=Cladophialophora carrionii TaxID=86049 RepID=A0A1C1D0V2_9EURO|nr:geranylgeranyl transferase beta subunit [Cladophialophora carrionii]